MIKITKLIFAIIILSCNYSIAQNADSLKYEKIIKVLSLKENHNADIPRKMYIIANEMLGTPYVAGTLEKIPEQLVVNLNQTDCILMVESTLAIALASDLEFPAFNNFKEILQNLRYRDGVIEDYSSRIHYTSEWITQAERRGILKEMTKDLGGVESGQKFNFITTHTKSYKQLSDNPGLVEKIAETENELNKNKYYYIPTNKIKDILPLLKTGDIIGFNTSIDGLDILHVGLIYNENGKVGFIHASMSGKKVMIEPISIEDYVRNNKKMNGIRIIRVL